MKKKDLCDYSFDFNTISKLMTLLGRNIFFLDDETKRIYKMKICQLLFQEGLGENEICFEFICTPVSESNGFMYNGDIVLSFDDLNSKWFYSYDFAQKNKRDYYMSRQLSLF